MHYLRAFTILICTGLLWIGNDAHAAVYKCVSPDGHVRYSDKTCVTAAKRVGTQSGQDDAEDRSANLSADMREDPMSSDQSSLDMARTIKSVEHDGVEAGDGDAYENPSHVEFNGPPPSRAPRSGNWGIFWLGFIAACVASLIHIVSAFRAGWTGWGIALLLLAPISNLLFTVRHWREARFGFLLAVAGTVACVSAYVPPEELVEVSDSFMTARGNFEADDRRERNAFSLSDTVHLKTVVDWRDWSVHGIHNVTWVWYVNGQVLPYQTQVLFDEDTRVLLGYMPAETLGQGKHRVELYLEDRLLDVRSFSVAL